jgi:glycosyltransferase involved in cell wall biosynthesis
MARNEEYFIGYVLQPLLEVLDHVIIVDTGSGDNTVQIIREACQSFSSSKYTILLYNPLTPEANGRVRQIMTGLVETEFALLVDADEYYPLGVLERIKNTELPDTARLGFTTLQTLQWQDGEFQKAERWSKQALFHAKSTKWEGAYPFEGPSWYARPTTFYYYPDCVGFDLHHLQRSSLDHVTPHRHDNIRPLQGIIESIKLPFELGRWPNPYYRSEVRV